MKRLYLDYNATAPLRPEAHATMVEALAETGNASSVHGEGQAAHRRIVLNTAKQLVFHGRKHAEAPAGKVLHIT